MVSAQSDVMLPESFSGPSGLPAHQMFDPVAHFLCGSSTQQVVAGFIGPFDIHAAESSGIAELALPATSDLQVQPCCYGVSRRQSLILTFIQRSSL
ncbi:hypothetical protein WT09_03885 [Burkholderia stagnalis]|nr:hypothetical protein WT02_27420 [Burkholderia stagnalis]KVM03472.1 hypothetical protein WT04_27210 [Burkholderia stagnalis]KVM99404.1 hypothetical protein WT07_22415 [Burkholderia stagnalis]KVN24034.1 hypothetical protein WT09_03885 [Burkholderia stagnalis]KVN53428.1 hypothetical protein WT14_31680 [Burkholderia stagnalis]